MIGLGGIFGIGEHHTRAAMCRRHDAYGRDEFARGSNIDQISQKVDAYWKTKLASAAVVPDD